MIPTVSTTGTIWRYGASNACQLGSSPTAKSDCLTSTAREREIKLWSENQADILQSQNLPPCGAKSMTITIILAQCISAP